MEQEKIKEETIDMLKRTSQSEVGTIYQLGKNWYKNWALGTCTTTSFSAWKYSTLGN